MSPSVLDEILHFNEDFVAQKEYEQFRTSRYPDKKMVILTCMDTRLVELLTKAMNLKNGDAKIIRNAGAIVQQPFGNIMRSIFVALFELNADEIYVIGHYDCGMTGLTADSFHERLKSNGVDPKIITTLKSAGININAWWKGFQDVEEGVRRSVDIIRNHPLLPPNIPVHGLIIDPETGKLDLITDGRQP